MKIRIGTRGSQLALWQANETARLLTEKGHQPEIVTIKTTGDKRTDVPLAAIGGKGLFVKELEEALTAGEVDLAVHSLKDVPSEIPDAFVLSGFLARADARDAWLHPTGLRIDQLPAGSTVATSSPRRKAQVIARFPELKVVQVRGNVDTRINKLRAGEFDGLLLASAGLHRLGRKDEITDYFSFEEMIPAAGQGIVAFEILRTRNDVQAVCEEITDAAARDAALIERGLLQRFGTLLDCYSAIAAHAVTTDGRLVLRSFLSDFDGKRAIRAEATGKLAERDTIIDSVHASLVEQGAHELLKVNLT